MLKTVLGLQFGDEGKGKLTDFFAKDFDYIVRYQGGDNAGHSININGKKMHCRIMPSGIFSNKKVVIGNGTCININILLQEIEYVNENWTSVNDKLFISELANVIMPYHIAMDVLNESTKDDEHKIGTTKRGIGPCYTDSYERVGIKVKDLFNYDQLLDKVTVALIHKNVLFKANNMPEFDPVEVAQEYFQLGQRIKRYTADTILVLNEAYKSGKNILLEGAQGSMLDINFGTYPFVTSSSPMTMMSQGTGLSCGKFTNVVGIVKAYLTRVGAGPMPTELHDEVAHTIRERGHEYGVVTKRPRRIGWLDLVQLKYTTMISGCNEIVLTLLDVLTGFEEIKVCTHYEDENGKAIYNYVQDEVLSAKLKPVYKTLLGWDEDISKMTSYSEIPELCKQYVNFISDFLEIPVSYVSVGPDREQTIKVERN
ncbi:adenylosuccinate synthase [Ureaplasma ceti]|uniref:Adenylosuccinate synthetase n=1 Tax=Ureaplasma ceti TaxID=3119530 RepID=A0ABP9UC73_9BACT